MGAAAGPIGLLVLALGDGVPDAPGTQRLPVGAA
jgi:hypothetical protein